jgi:chromosome partitioning protein
MASVLSTINLKGGVAKTTTTIALAETFSAELGKKVLVIDLDPQTNATTMLIGEDRWRELNDKEHALARLFKDALDPRDKRFDLDKSLQRRVSDVSAARTIDLLPSSIDLIDVQDQLASTPSGRFYSVNPVELLWQAVKSRLDDYDIVLVDCPPNLGIITLNGLRISQGYVIPTSPDILSTYGIPQIVKRVREFSEEIAETVEPLGIIVTKYQPTRRCTTTCLGIFVLARMLPSSTRRSLRRGISQPQQSFPRVHGRLSRSMATGDSLIATLIWPGRSSPS